MMKQLPVFPHPVTHALMWGDLGKGKGEVKAAKLLVGWGMEWGVWGYTGIWAKHPLTYSVGVSPNSSSSSVISGTLKYNDNLFRSVMLYKLFWNLFCTTAA